MEKEQWIDEVLQSAKAIVTVESNPFMATRIEARLQSKPATTIPVQWMYATVAAMLIVLFINISIWRNTNVANRSNTEMQQLMQEYGWTNHDIYSNSN